VINFFSLIKTPYTIFGFIALSILAVGYYYFMKIMTPLLSLSFNNNMFPVYLIMGAAGLTFLTFQVDNPLLIFYILVLGWLIFYVWLSQINFFGINNQRQTMAGGLFWIFIFSVSLTAVIINANREKEWQSRIGLAEKVNRKTDPDNERELGITLTYFDNDFFAPNFYRFSQDQRSASFLRDSLLSQSDYLRNYNSRLYVFDAQKNPLYNDQPEPYNDLETKMEINARQTSVPNLFYFNTSFNSYTFIFKQTVTDPSGNILGYFFILSDPDRGSSDELEVELFKKGDGDPEIGQNYSYAVYEDDVLKLTSLYNKYPFHTALKSSDRPVESVEKRITAGYTELWYKAKNFKSDDGYHNKVVVVVRKRANVLEAITLFSYIFCVFLFLVGVFNALVLLLRLGGDITEFRRILEWNIRTQIHSTIIFISILSFIIIGVSTISFFILRYKQNNEERLGRTMDITIKQMEQTLDKRRQLDDLLAIYDSVSNDQVTRLVNEVAEIHSVDVNVYDTNGRLYVSSQPIIYRENFFSRQMHPLGFYHLNRLREVQHLQTENLGHCKPKILGIFHI